MQGAGRDEAMGKTPAGKSHWFHLPFELNGTKIASDKGSEEVRVAGKGRGQRPYVRRQRQSPGEGKEFRWTGKERPKRKVIKQAGERMCDVLEPLKSSRVAHVPEWSIRKNNQARCPGSGAAVVKPVRKEPATATRV